VREHGAEITREIARGAIHVVDERSVDVEQLASAVVNSVVETTIRAGADPYDAMMGTSQGIIQGTAEAQGDLTAAATGTIESAAKIASRSGMSEERAVAEATEGVLQAAEAIGDEAVTRVMEALVQQ